MGRDGQVVTGPLGGARVLDLASGALGAIGRTLAELGADVARVEPPTGGADRCEGPSAGGVSLSFAAANLGKRSLAIDLGETSGISAFHRLAAQADILIESTRPGSPEARRLDLPALRRGNPRLVVLSVSDFGADGPDWRASDAVLHALSGELSRSGVPGRAPLLPPGEIAIQCAAAQGAYLAMVGYLNAQLTGDGDHLDLSLLDAVTQALDPGYGIAGSARAGALASKLPRGRPDVRHQYPILPCRDGYVRLCILAARQWRGLFDYMGRPAEFADPAFDDVRHRFASSALLPAIAAFFADKTRSEIEAGGERFKFPAAGLLTLDEALASDQIQSRGAFAEVQLAPGVTAPLPDGVMEIDGCRAGLRGPPPAAPEAPEALIAAWSEPRAHRNTEAGFGAPGRPLAGLRVLDLGVIVVGAEQGRLLADFGAEVIKVETAAFPDGSRIGSPERVAPTFAAGHRNKLSFGLNLREPEGRALFLELAEQADVILSNFKPGTLESLGLGPERLLERNPRLILADSSAYGGSGPWSGRMGYGPLVRASAGLTDQWRYEDDAASFCDAMTVYPDHVAARTGVTGVLALLVRRLRTGAGGTVSVSQTEVMLGQMAAQVAERVLSERGEPLAGEPFRDAPWGVFPCAGEDEWCVVSVGSDAQWRALCDLMGRADLAADVHLATRAGRAAQRRRIDEAVEAWTRAIEPHEAMARLQAAGVPAAAMLRVSELPEFDYFSRRGLFGMLDQAHLREPIVVDLAPLRSERLVEPPLGPAPLMGEHTRRIARDLLGLSEAQIDRLLDAGVLQGLQRAKA